MNRKIAYPPLYISLYILSLIAATSIKNLDRSGAQGFSDFLFWGAIYGLGVFIGWQHREKEVEKFHPLIIIFVVLALYTAFSNALSSKLEMGMIGFLLWLQAARNLTLSNRRELPYTYFISLVLILYAASKSVDASFLMTIFFYVLTGMFALMADHIDQKWSEAKGGDKAQLIKTMSLPAKGGILTVITLSLAALIYLFVPRLASPQVQAFPSGGGWFYPKFSS